MFTGPTKAWQSQTAFRINFATEAQRAHRRESPAGNLGRAILTTDNAEPMIGTVAQITETASEKKVSQSESHLCKSSKSVVNFPGPWKAALTQSALCSL
jgi:hypothetical protein